MASYDQYRGPGGTAPIDSCDDAIRACIEAFGLPMTLEGGIETHLGNGVYGTPSKLQIKKTLHTEDDLHKFLFGCMHGPVRLFFEGRKIRLIGCSGPYKWEVV